MNSVCQDCPMRLFHPKHYKIDGFGQPYYGKLIVIPGIDNSCHNADTIEIDKQVQIVLDCLVPETPSTGERRNLDIYIVPFIRCAQTKENILNEDIIRSCKKHLADDIKKYNFKDILLLGDAVKYLFDNCNIKDYVDKAIITNNNRRYVFNYSPFTKFTNEDLYNEFRNNITKWYDIVSLNRLNTYTYIHI